MGGALPFTNMQNLRTENNEDGTYRYEDFTQDGQILVVNTVEPTRFVPEVQDLEDYLTACAFALSDTDTYELLSATTSLDSCCIILLSPFDYLN